MDLIPLHSSCFIDKYTDDTYLIVQEGSDSYVQSEIDSIERWAMANNLRLNKNKSMEIIVFTSSRAKNKASPVKLHPGIERVESLKILGVQIDHNLSVSMHVGNACQRAA